MRSRPLPALPGSSPFGAILSVMQRPLLGRILGSLAVIGVLACGGGGGKANPAWLQYQAATKKILDEYDLAMNDVATIDTALVDFNGGVPKITTDVAVDQIDKVVIPKLAKVAQSAASLQTPN